MGKTLSRADRQESKYIKRETSRKTKVAEQNCSRLTPERTPKVIPKKKWKPHSEIEAN